jgi:hypothetical protein
MTEYLTDAAGKPVRNIGATRPTREQYDDAKETFTTWAEIMADEYADGGYRIDSYAARYREVRANFKRIRAAYLHKTSDHFEGSFAGERIPLEPAEPPVDPASLIETDCCQ